jgi:hypothetical protein
MRDVSFLLAVAKESGAIAVMFTGTRDNRRMPPSSSIRRYTLAEGGKLPCETTPEKNTGECSYTIISRMVLICPKY